MIPRAEWRCGGGVDRLTPVRPCAVEKIMSIEMGGKMCNSLKYITKNIALPMAIMTFAPFAAAADAMTLPSGQTVTLVEVLNDGSGSAENATRFRFLAPSISGRKAIDAEAALADIAWVCENFALPQMPALNPKATQIVVSLMDRDVPYGETDEAATQYFDAFLITNGTCELELFYD